MRPKLTISMRSRPVSEPLSVSENSPTAAWPLRSSGTAHRPEVAPLGDAEPADLAARERDRLRRRRERLAAHRAQKLVLPVAGDARDAENLARPHVEARHPVERDAEFARLRQAQASRRELGRAEAARSAGLAISLRLRADHHLGHRARGLALRDRNARRPCRRAGWSRCRRARRSRAACGRCRGSSSRSPRACARSRTIARPPAASAPRSARP